jgi:hyperosmotically inducible periplasmic protein
MTMKYANAIIFAALAGITIVSSTGCAVGRGQESVGAYVDDTGITTVVKTSISVETMKGVVQLSGFAKSNAEKMQAENIARNVKNVKSVRNDIIVRP